MLLLLLEFSTWKAAKHWAYTAQLGLEEGLQANGVEYLSLATPCFGRAREICSGQKFDQVWVEIVHNDNPRGEWFDWVASLAPIRIGMIAESLNYDSEDYLINPVFATRKARVKERFKYLTHVLVSDEKDADEINAEGEVHAFWWPQAVPRRFVFSRPSVPKVKTASFCGAVYGNRGKWLNHVRLQQLLTYQQSPEARTVLPLLFDQINRNVQRYMRRRWLPGCGGINRFYLNLLRQVRRRCFSLWLEGLCSASAVVNLPHLVKAYPGRVVEGMAAGRPVISWEIPDRPRNKALFQDAKEIFLYSKDDPGQLAELIARLLRDSTLATTTAENARKRVLAFHTMEVRVRQILDWIETDVEPVYS